MNNSIEYVKKVLAELADAGIEAYVAGGWIRDLDNGIDPKDVDIFVHGVVDYTEIRDVLTDASILGYGASRYYRNYSNEERQSVMRDDVTGVLKCHGTGIDVVLMNSETIEETCRNFDVSICQIYGKLVDGELCIYVSTDYLEWKSKGIIYEYTNIPTTQNHLDRVKKKFNVDLTPKVIDSIRMVEWCKL